MYLRMPELLTDDELTRLDAILAEDKFQPGAATAGQPTKAVKNNLQFDLASHPQRDELLRLVNQAVQRSRLFRTAVLPKRLSLPLLSKYEPGMRYGWHIDNAIMQTPNGPMRSDVACTVFLSHPDSYEGGELTLQAPTGEMRVKLKRGDAFVYPATTLHQVDEVTSGERRALVFWIQSIVADASKREIIHELDQTFAIAIKENPNSESIRHLQRIQANLLRLWSEV